MEHHNNPTIPANGYSPESYTVATMTTSQAAQEHPKHVLISCCCHCYTAVTAQPWSPLLGLLLAVVVAVKVMVAYISSTAATASKLMSTCDTAESQYREKLILASSAQFAEHEQFHRCCGHAPDEQAC